MEEERKGKDIDQLLLAPCPKGEVAHHLLMIARDLSQEGATLLTPLVEKKIERIADPGISGRFYRLALVLMGHGEEIDQANAQLLKARFLVTKSFLFHNLRSAARSYRSRDFLKEQLSAIFAHIRLQELERARVHLAQKALFDRLSLLALPPQLEVESLVSLDESSWKALRVGEDQTTVIPSSLWVMREQHHLVNCYVNQKEGEFLGCTSSTVDSEQKVKELLAIFSWSLACSSTSGRKIRYSFRVLTFPFRSLRPFGVGKSSFLLKFAKALINMNPSIAAERGSSFFTYSTYLLNGYTNLSSHQQWLQQRNLQAIAIEIIWVFEELIEGLFNSYKETIFHQAILYLHSLKRDVDQITELEEKILLLDHKVDDEIHEERVFLEERLRELANQRDQRDQAEGELDKAVREDILDDEIEAIGRKLKEIDHKTPLLRLEQAYFHQINDVELRIAKSLPSITSYLITLKEFILGLNQKEDRFQKEEAMIDLLHIRLAPSVAVRSNFATELGAQFLLDRLLEVKPIILSEKGIDKAALARALLKVIDHEIEERSCTALRGEVFRTLTFFFQNFAVNLERMDRRFQHEREVEKDDFDDWYRYFLALLEDHEREILRFQALFLAEIVAIALPISARSVGFFGLNWKKNDAHSHLWDQRNRPLSLFPYAIVDEEGRFHPFVDVRRGRRKFVRSARSYLVGFSAWRCNPPFERR